MADYMGLILGTIALRPYVFVFLVVYLIAACCHMGSKRAFFYLPVGYTVAWASEFLSIHTGIPYGIYRYIPVTQAQELWVYGVPFMDSISYVFLSYAAYSLAYLISGSWSLRNRLWHSIRPSSSWMTTFVGTLFFVFLDIIIDPIALRGDRWFLGKIYEYPNGGAYFGIPLSNFLGWFIVGIALMRILQALDPSPSCFILKTRKLIGIFIGPILYYSILLFNIAITAWIGETLLLVVDLLLVGMFSLTVLLYVFKINRAVEVYPQDILHGNP